MTAVLFGPWGYLIAVPVLAALAWAGVAFLNRLTAPLARMAHKPPAGGKGHPPAPPRTRPPGLHRPPHNPMHPGAVIYVKPCGCWRKLDGLSGRELGKRVCDQAPTWAQWEREMEDHS